jgi:photosystem II stability/assembly factor-like uncharacterized protein
MFKYIYFTIILILLFCFQSALVCNSRWSVVEKLEYKSGDAAYDTQFMAIKTADKKNIIAVANISGQAPCMIKSQDSGKTWKIKYLDTIKGTYWRSAVANEMVCPDTNLAVIICDSGYYFRSVDNGESWKKFRFQNNRKGREVVFWDNKTGIVLQSSVGLPQVIQKTTDGGLSWFEIPGPKSIQNGFGDIHTFGKGICYFIELVLTEADSLFYIHKSTDYGVTWEVYPSAKYPPTGVFYFYNENLGFCYGSGHINWDLPETQYIRKTTDGGKTWKTVLDTTYIWSSNIAYMHFCDSLNGIATSIGSVFRTYNGGNTWVVDTSFYYENFKYYIYKLLLLDKYTALGTARWSWPYIYRYTEDKGTSVVEDFFYYFINVYPNPALNELNYDLPDDVNYDGYKIYDIAGNVIQSGLFNSTVALNKQTINIEKLSLGAYYLMLHSKNRNGYSMFIKQK